jgi:hypothetical protein
VILLLHDDRFAARSQFTQHRFLGGGKGGCRRQPLEPDLVTPKPAAVLLDHPDVAAHSQVDQRRGERPIVGAHFPHVAHRGRGQIVGR